MKDYELYARKYPAIIAMLIPAILTSILVASFVTQIDNFWVDFIMRASVFIPVAMLYSAIGYFARQLFRDASKMIFQFPMFKEDETEMPTTRLLCWKDSKRFSKEELQMIASKVQGDFNIHLLTEKESKKNPIEAKKTIVSAVGKIREVTRTNPNLLQYNIDFGFCRNYLGGSAYAIAIIITIAIINSMINTIDWRLVTASFILQIVLSVIVFITLRYKGFAYARALFNAYTTNAQYNWNE